MMQVVARTIKRYLSGAGSGYGGRQRIMNAWPEQVHDLQFHERHTALGAVGADVDAHGQRA